MTPRSRVAVIVPVYGAVNDLRACLESLAQHLPDWCRVIVADDASPDQDIGRIVKEEFGSRIPGLVYRRNSVNCGFVENCNQAVADILGGGEDILLLNSDTVVTEGAIEEMYAVLHLHERHAVVTPRSNNATIYSVPVGWRMKPQESYELWQSIRPHLPRYAVMPTAVGYCMLVRNEIIREWGLFDPVYSPGYNEENDFVCRINRRGYSAVVAHHAFVFHMESASFGPRRRELERRNSAELRRRYPEYSRMVATWQSSYMDPVDHFAPLWAGNRNKTVLFDLFHLPAKHSGTSEFALSLLLHLEPMLSESGIDVSVGLSTEARKFFGNELTGYRMFDPDAPGERDAVFDLVFRPSQIFRWEELFWMIRRGARIAYSHQDCIAVRCAYLDGPNTRELFRFSAEIADRVFTISEYSRVDFNRMYDSDVHMQVIHHGSHYRPVAAPRDGYVLLAGNSYDHKALREGVEAVAGCGLPVVVLGLTSAEAGKVPLHVRFAPSGNLSRSEINDLFAGASVVVYPSVYEGFGLPIIDGLALGRPVIAMEGDMNRELLRLCGSERLILAKAFADLAALVTRCWRGPETASQTQIRSWRDAAAEYAESFRAMLDTPPDVAGIRCRWQVLRRLTATCAM